MIIADFTGIIFRRNNIEIFYFIYFGFGVRFIDAFRL